MYAYYIVLAIIICIITHMLWTKRKLPPGPWGLPILGYLPWLNTQFPYKTLTDLSHRFGPIYGLSLGNVYTVVLTDPNLVKKLFLMNSTTGRAPLYLTHGIMDGYGLICAEGDLWKEHRRFIHDCLRQMGGSKSGTSKKKMESLIMRNVLDFTTFMDKQNEALDPLGPLRHSLGSAINEIVFGISWSRNDKTWKWLQHLQEEGTKKIGVAGPLNFLPFLRFLPKFKQTMDFLIEGKCETHKVYQKIIDGHTERISKQCSDDLDTIQYTNIIQAFILEKMKKSDDLEIVKKFYNDQQFYHLLADIFGAGLDTTLTTLRWYLLYLAQNQSIQQEVRAEIQDVLQSKLPSMEDLPHLPLVEASICEAQRIRSVIPVGIPHGSLENIEIEGYTIPKGTMIVPLQWAMHMHETIWPDPEKFDPARFIDGEGNIKKSEYFMPFQVGKRMCVGDELARMLLFLFCVTILQNFTLELPKGEVVDLTGECGITLTPKEQKIVFNKVP